jgi:hypothetical protein
VPRQVVPRDIAELPEASRRETIQRLRNHWVEIDALFKKSDRVYNDFVASANPGGFIQFLRGAKDIYWQLGDSLSKINHAINCWDISTKTFSRRRLPGDRLEGVLDLLKAILVPSVALRVADVA